MLVRKIQEIYKKERLLFMLEQALFSFFVFALTLAFSVFFSETEFSYFVRSWVYIALMQIVFSQFVSQYLQVKAAGQEVSIIDIWCNVSILMVVLISISAYLLLNFASGKLGLVKEVDPVGVVLFSFGWAVWDVARKVFFSAKKLRKATLLSFLVLLFSAITFSILQGVKAKSNMYLPVLGMVMAGIVIFFIMTDRYKVSERSMCRFVGASALEILNLRARLRFISGGVMFWWYTLGFTVLINIELLAEFRAAQNLFAMVSIYLVATESQAILVFSKALAEKGSQIGAFVKGWVRRSAKESVIFFFACSAIAITGYSLIYSEAFGGYMSGVVFLAIAYFFLALSRSFVVFIKIYKNGAGLIPAHMLAMSVSLLSVYYIERPDPAFVLMLSYMAFCFWSFVMYSFFKRELLREYSVY